jgi:hypothetical protein
MDSKLDAYEFIADLPAGIVLGLALYLLCPSLFSAMSMSGEFGEAGLLLILAFVLGKLVRVVSHQFEWRLWAFAGGWPTNWVRTAAAGGDKKAVARGRALISDDQFNRLNIQLVRHTGKGVRAVDVRAWHLVVREIDVRVRAAGSAVRIDAFNRTYGLFAGLGTAFLLAFVLMGALAFAPPSWSSAPETYALGAVLSALAVAILLCIQGAKVAGIAYARELYLEFIALPADVDADD